MPGFPCIPQVDQILALRSDLMEAAERLRRSEAERLELEAGIGSLRQQVRAQAGTGWGCCDLAAELRRGGPLAPGHARTCLVATRRGRFCTRHAPQVSEKRGEAEREGRKRERLEKEARDLRAQVESKAAEVRAARPWPGSAAPGRCVGLLLGPAALGTAAMLGFVCVCGMQLRAAAA